MIQKELDVAVTLGLEVYLAFRVFSEFVSMFQPFMTGIAHAATGYQYRAGRF